MVWGNPNLNKEKLPVKPILFYVQNAKGAENDSDLLIDKTPVVVDDHFTDEFAEGIHKVVEDIFDESLPFSPTQDTKQCTNCPFYEYCY